MGPLHSPKEYLFNLYATSSSEAKRLWKKQIREKWGNKCAYCHSSEKLTIDHIVPHIKGGTDVLTNLVCCCEKCNRDKAHINWKQWYREQDFFTEERMSAILDWMVGEKPEETKLYRYKERRNNAS